MNHFEDIALKMWSQDSTRIRGKYNKALSTVVEGDMILIKCLKADKMAQVLLRSVGL